MKNNYFLRFVFTVLLCGYFSMSYGADWYISATGSDSTGDGSMGNPWASFSKAQTAAASADVIYVSGMIDMWSDPANTVFTQISATPTYSTTNKTGITITKNLTIQGTSPATDGFTGTNGTNSTRIFQILSNVTVTMNNLKLANGKIISSLLSADSNYTNVLGGALLIKGGTINTNNVVFDSNSSNLRGGAVSITPASAVTVAFNNTLFKSNSSTTEGGAFNYTDASALASTITFTNCALISNSCGGTTLGGAAYINNGFASPSLQISFINTTIAKNSAGGTSAGAMLIANAFSNSSINLINCTITENTSTTSATGGSGIRVLTPVTTNGGVVKIQNSILENNYCPTVATNTTNYTSDFAWQGEGFLVGTKLIIENSYIGRPMQASNTKWLVATNSFPTSKYNYITATSGDVRNSYIAKFGTFNTTTNSYPLLSTSAAIEYGAQSFLSAVGVTTDQIGNTRAFAGGFCTAGAIEHSLPVNEKIWKGITSTDATVASNWAYGSVPTATDFITIIKKTFDPVFDNITINGGLIETGAKLFVEEGKILTNNGTITNNGSLVLKANATGNASLVSATPVANVQLQRFLSSNQRGWRLLSNPLSSTTFAALATSSNLTLGANFTGEYLPVSNTWTSTDGTVAMDSQKAYKLFITGQAGEAPDYVTGPTNVTIKITGTAANTAPATIATTAGQFYLVANPYTAPLSVSSIIAASTGLSNTVSYYNPNNAATDVKVKAGGYDTPTVSGAAGSATDVVIPAMGAIFVQATADGSINVPTSAIFTGTPLQAGTYNHKVAQKNDTATPTLKLEINSDGIYYDALALRFRATTDASSNIDFGKLPNSILDTYSIVASNKMAVSELELAAQTIPLGITSSIQKNYTFNVSENSIPTGYEAVLVDTYLNTTTVLAQGTDYVFTIDSNPASQGEARFAINLRTAGTLGVTVNELDSKIQLWPNPARAEVNITNGQNANDGAVRIEISSLNGQLIHTQKSNPGTTTTIQTKGWATGVYILKASQNGTETTKKLIIQ